MTKSTAPPSGSEDAAFFIPYATSAEESESVYHSFLEIARSYPLQHPTARLRRIVFHYKGRNIIAEVGRELSWFPETVGAVLAIVATTNLVFVFTHLRGGLSETPIYVSPNEVSERGYFTDYPHGPTRDART